MPRRPIRRLRGNFVPSDGTSAPDFEALDAAVRLARRPDTARFMRARPVPKGVVTLFRILGNAEEATALAVRRLRRDPAFIRSVASFYVEQVLWTGDPDHYRVLGVARDAPQEHIVDNLRAALAWLMPYAGTRRWEGDFAAAVVAAGRVIGTEEDRIAYDLAAWSELATAPAAAAPRKAMWRSAAVAIASLAWLAVMSGNFRAGGIVDVPVAGRPTATSAATEADPSIAVVRVKVVKGQDSVAAVTPPAPVSQPSAAPIAVSEASPAPVELPRTDTTAVALASPPAAAPIELPRSDATTTAPAAPDFATAFQPDDAAPGGGADAASTSEAENPAASESAAPESTVQPPTVVAATDKTAGVIGEAASQPLFDSSAMASPADDRALAGQAAAATVNPPDATALANVPDAPAVASQPDDGVTAGQTADDAAIASLPEDAAATAGPADDAAIAKSADAAEAAPAATEDLSPPPPAEKPDQPAKSVKVAALAATEAPLELVPADAPAVVASPSFKCSKAYTAVERAICDDSTLAGKDREMAKLYRQARAQGSSRSAAMSRQVAWLRDRDSCGKSTTCIESAYDSRIRELTAQIDQ